MNNKNEILYEYAKYGWHIHPLKELMKTPLLNGWKEKSTTNNETIRNWLRQYRYANYGIQTGEKSGIWVLDIDCKKGDDGLKSLQNSYPEFNLSDLEVPIVETPTGGYHVYFKYPEDRKLSNSVGILPGVDVRGEGGYVVAPPSVLESDDGNLEYKWINRELSNIDYAPDYLINLATNKQTLNRNNNSVSSGSKLADTNDINDLSGVNEGKRDDYIFNIVWGSKKAGLDKEETLIKALTAAGNCAPPFEEDLVCEKVDRIYSNYEYANRTTDKKTHGDKSEVKKIIEDFNKRYAVVMAGTKTLVLDEDKRLKSDSINECLLTFDDFNKFYCNKHIEIKTGNNTKKIQSSKYWLSHENRRQYENIIFDPSNRHEENEFNFWKGFPVQGQAGRCSLFWSYVENVICSGDIEAYVYLRKWIAHIFQKPAELPRTAIVITGKQGTGKSTLTKILSKLLHKQNYLEVSSVERLMGKFNGNLANRLLVNANEAFWGGDKAHSGELKAMITDNYMTIEMKGKDSFKYQNYARYIFTTNSSYPVNTDADDRRFVFLECSDEKKGDAKYWNELNELMSTDSGLSALMYDLENEDISNWKPENRPSCNIEKQLDIKYRSMPTIEKFVFEWVKNKEIEKYSISPLYSNGYVVDAAVFYGEYREWVVKTGIQDKHTTPQIFGSTIANNLIPIKKKRSNGKTYWHMRSWGSIYNHYCANVIYSDPNWDQEYEKSTKTRKKYRCS